MRISRTREHQAGYGRATPRQDQTLAARRKRDIQAVCKDLPFALLPLTASDPTQTPVSVASHSVT